MILEIDAGNTRVKWRIVGEDSVILERGVLALDNDSLLHDLAKRFPVIETVRLSCVAKNEIQQAIAGEIFSRWGVAVLLAQTQAIFEGLTVAYENPQRLGVDRWLAMLAARSEFNGAVCVIDCGSAVTVDMVAADGQHLGGYIVPGLAMQQKTLLDSTGQIYIEKDDDRCTGEWGVNTTQAVNLGVARMIVSFINEIVDGLLATGDQPMLFLTGGDGAKLLPRLKHQKRYHYRSELVMDGLAIALPVNGLV